MRARAFRQAADLPFARAFGREFAAVLESAQILPPSPRRVDVVVVQHDDVVGIAQAVRRTALSKP